MHDLKLAVLVGLGFAASACSEFGHSGAAGQPEPSGRTLATEVCASCHGREGHSGNSGYPNLAAQQRDYLVAQLSAFHNHHREDTAGYQYMWNVAGGLSKEQVSELADYYSQQRPAEPQPVDDPALATAGRKIFETGVPERKVPACETCHGAEAQGNGAFPRLADQYSDYLIKQLQAFRNTDARPEGAVMKSVTHDLTTHQMEALAAYLQSMPPR